MRLMLDFPWEMHCYLIEPLSNTPHIYKVLIQRFLKFLQQIRKSNKESAKSLLNLIYQDTRSTTGSNLRNILLKTNKSHIDELVPSDAEGIEYHPICIEEKWKVQFISEIIETKHKQLEISNLEDDDLDKMLTFLCVS